MQFHVPQFLEVEDKIFSILTLKQFLYLFGGIAIAYLAWTYLYWLLALPVIVAGLGFGISLAFVKINNRPFLVIVDAFLHYIFSPRLYIWKKIPRPIEKKEEVSVGNAGVYVPPLSGSKLKDLSWSLDIKEHRTANEANKPEIIRNAPLLKDI